jgi:hypothetical protein
LFASLSFVIETKDLQLKTSAVCAREAILDVDKRRPNLGFSGGRRKVIQRGKAWATRCVTVAAYCVM